MSRHTEELVTKGINLRDHMVIFENTVDVAISDGVLELHEIDALLNLIHAVETDVGKLRYRLARMRQQVILANAPIASTGIELDIPEELDDATHTHI